MPLDVDTPLNGEMPKRDFSLDSRIPNEREEDYSSRLKVLFKEVGIMGGLWLYRTIEGGFQWSDDAKFEEHQKEVADFLNETAKGPYYAHIGFINARATLGLVFMEKADAQAFVHKFGESHHYKMDSDKFDRNLETLKQRHTKIGWVPKDERLLPYLEQALAL